MVLTGLFRGPLRGRGSPLEGLGVCIGGVTWAPMEALMDSANGRSVREAS